MLHKRSRSAEDPRSGGPAVEYGSEFLGDRWSAGAVGRDENKRQRGSGNRLEHRQIGADRGRKRRDRYGGEAPKRANRTADRAIVVVMSMPGIRRGLIFTVFVVADQERQQAVGKIVISGGIGAGPVGRQRVGEIEGEMDRDKRVEAERDRAQPGGDGADPQAMWQHCRLFPPGPQPDMPLPNRRASPKDCPPRPVLLPRHAAL